jgi:hypothetical protein
MPRSHLKPPSPGDIAVSAGVIFRELPQWRDILQSLPYKKDAVRAAKVAVIGKKNLRVSAGACPMKSRRV